MVRLEALDQLDQQVNQDLKEPEAKVVHLDSVVRLAQGVRLAHLEQMDAKENAANKEQLGPQGSKAHLEHRAHVENKVNVENLDKEVKLVHQAHLVDKEREVSLVHLVQMDNRDPVVKLDHKGLKAREVKLDPGVKLVVLVHQAGLENVAKLAKPAPQEPRVDWVNGADEARQAHVENQDLLEQLVSHRYITYRAASAYVQSYLY